MSGLDVESESNVRQAVSAVLPNCTTLVVTHRFTSLHADDAVLVLKHGAVGWQGTYQQTHPSARYSTDSNRIVFSFLQHPQLAQSVFSYS